MKLYKDGNFNSGGFRFLTNGMLCVDICEENFPLQTYFDDLIKYINKTATKRIFINGSLSESIDVSFLCDLNLIEEIKISALCSDLKPIYVVKPKILHIQKQRESLDFEELKDFIEDIDIYNLNPHFNDGAELNDNLLNCKKLKKFGISHFNKTDSEIMKKLIWLEELNISYSKEKNFDISIFNNMKKLKRLILQQVSFDSLNKLNNLVELEELKLVQISISSLDGIENFKELKYLTINYCTKLKDISKISECTKLKKIEFDTCKKIENFNQLSTLKEVKGLVIGKCGSIPSLSFIQKMTGLKFLSFVNTNIVDGDLTPCLELENVGMKDEKHYNVKSKDLPKNKEYSFWKL